MEANPLRRRDLLIGLGSGLLALGLGAACAPTRGGNTTSPAGATVPPVAVRTPGPLILGQTAAIPSTDPFPSGPALNAFKWAMFNPLISLDDKAQPLPMLAESWSYSEDRLRLRLHLRPDIKFHSGRPFTSEAVKWNIERAQDPTSQAAVGGELKPIQVRPVDALSVDLVMPDTSYPHIFSLLANVMMADPESDLKQAAAGTGAYRLDALDPGIEMRLVRNTNYFRPDRPLVDAVTIKTLPDPEAATVALEAGSAHIVWSTAADTQRLRQGQGTSAAVLRASGSYDILISTVDPPFDDKRVRQAIDLALDRKRFAESLMYGLTDPTYIVWLRSSPAWDASIDTGEFNLDKARQLLVDAGYANGFETKIQTNGAYPELSKFAEVLQSDLAKIGVKLSIEPMDAVQANATVTQARFPAMMTHVWGSGDGDPALQFTAFILRPTGNATRFQSDAYVNQISAARRETDFDKRIALYRQLALFIKDSAFVLPLANAAYTFGLRSNVHGFTRQPTAGSPVLEEIWLS